MAGAIQPGFAEGPRNESEESGLGVHRSGRGGHPAPITEQKLHNEVAYTIRAAPLGKLRRSVRFANSSIHKVSIGFFVSNANSATLKLQIPSLKTKYTHRSGLALIVFIEGLLLEHILNRKIA
jgi:hypothetical protein